MRRTLRSKKLLVASLGVASVSYACSKPAPDPLPVGNLMAVPTSAPDAAPPLPPAPHVGNLMPPPMPADAGAPPAGDAGSVLRKLR